MTTELKQRMVGGVILVLMAIIFIPFLLHKRSADADRRQNQANVEKGIQFSENGKLINLALSNDTSHTISNSANTDAVTRAPASMSDSANSVTTTSSRDLQALPGSDQAGMTQSAVGDNNINMSPANQGLSVPSNNNMLPQAASVNNSSNAASQSSLSQSSTDAQANHNSPEWAINVSGTANTGSAPTAAVTSPPETVSAASSRAPLMDHPVSAHGTSTMNADTLNTLTAAVNMDNSQAGTAVDTAHLNASSATSLNGSSADSSVDSSALPQNMAVSPEVSPSNAAEKEEAKHDKDTVLGMPATSKPLASSIGSIEPAATETAAKSSLQTHSTSYARTYVNATSLSLPVYHGTPVYHGKMIDTSSQQTVISQADDTKSPRMGYVLSVPSTNHMIPTVSSRVPDVSTSSSHAEWVIQVASFSNESNALRLLAQLRAQGLSAYSRASTLPNGIGMIRVFIGPLLSQTHAVQIQNQLHVGGIIKRRSSND